MQRRSKVSTESTLRPAPPSTRVLVTATWQMVGVHNRGSAPEPAKLAGWSSELKVRPTSRAARSVGAPSHAETTPIWRANSLTWRLVGGACEPPRRAATTGSVDVVVRQPGRIDRCRGGACCSPPARPVAVLTASGGERRERPPARAAGMARARSAPYMDEAVEGERSSEKQITAHPYLARQMSDHGFRQTLKVRTLGCARRSCPLPLRLVRNKLREEQHKRHRVYTSSGHHCGVIPYSSLWWVDCLLG